MTSRAAAAALALGVVVAGCGGGSHDSQRRSDATTSATIEATEVPVSGRAAPAPAEPPVQALVTDETRNRLLVVDLPSGRVVRRIALPRDPEDISANSGECSTAVVAIARCAGGGRAGARARR